MSADPAAAPSGVVTFLFTDVEGSTRRWETDADAMRAALAAHDEVLRTAIEAHDGFLFSHTGDGVVAAFASPMSAVNAAVDAQRELQLPVRMGLATGEAELRDGDYFGAVLNRAAQHVVMLEKRRPHRVRVGLPPTGRTLNIGEQERDDPRRSSRRVSGHPRRISQQTCSYLVHRRIRAHTPAGKARRSALPAGRITAAIRHMLGSKR